MSQPRLGDAGPRPQRSLHASSSSLRALRTESYRKWGLPSAEQTHARARGTFRGLQRPGEKQELLRWEEVVWSGKSTEELMTFEVCLITVQILGAGGEVKEDMEEGLPRSRNCFHRGPELPLQALTIWKRTRGSPAARGEGTGAPRGRPGQVLKPSSLSSTRGNTADWGLGGAYSTCSREIL